MSLKITDHALQRLFERGAGSDVVAEIKAELATRLRRASSAAERLQQDQYHITLGGLRFVVRDGAVVTVLDAAANHNARKNGIAR